MYRLTCLLFHRGLFSAKLKGGGERTIHYFMYLFVALFEDLFYSFVLSHYSHSLILRKLMGFENSLLGCDIALLSSVITTV
jgi:hypothetical protein